MSIADIRSFARGNLSASELRRTLNESGIENDEFLDDDEFLQECASVAMGLILQAEMLDEAGTAFDQAIDESYTELCGYMASQEMINEAAISITNPKINYVRLNKQAQINRLTKIITLKMARKAKHPAFKKYKVAMALKKKNMGEMTKIYGARAERMAKQLWTKTSRNGKIQATIADKKVEVKKAIETKKK